MAGPHCRFGEFRIDPLARELWRAGERVESSPRVFDCIAYLIEHRERAVGRDELVAAVWGKTSVSDNLLGKTLLKARRLLGDNGDEQSFIRTIPRFGYRWVAEVTVETPTADASTTEVALAGDPVALPSAALTEPPAIAAPAMRERRRALLLLLALAILCLVPGIAWWVARLDANTAGTSRATATARVSADSALAAVLPAEVTAAAEWNWLRFGLMDLVADRLRATGQAVVPSASIVAMTRERSGADAIAAVRAGAEVVHLILPFVQGDDKDWLVRLELRTAGRAPRIAEAHGSDAIDAARRAADRLLALLGKAQPATPDGKPQASLIEFLQRSEAAVLVDDLTAARRWVDSAPAAMQAEPELRLRRALIDYRSGRLDHAQSALDSLRAELSAEAEPLLRARTLMGLGALALKRENAPAAEKAFDDALIILQPRNDAAVLGNAHMGRAVSRSRQGRYADALADYAQARIALELVGDTLALARIDLSEAAMSASRNDYPRALPLLERAERRFEQLDTPVDLGNVLANQIEVQLALLQPIKAQVIGERLPALILRAENPADQHFLQVSRARALVETGRSAEARALLDELIRSLDGELESWPLATARMLLARVDLSANQSATAWALAAASRDIGGGPARSRARAQAWLIVVRALHALGRNAEAADESRQFAAWADPSADPAAAVLARLAEAETARVDGRAAQAEAFYADALARAERLGVPIDVMTVLTSHAHALIDAGDLVAAGPVVGRTTGWAEHDFESAVLQLRFYHALGQHRAWQSALARVRWLAGERPIPAALVDPPARSPHDQPSA